ncbi:hypothetical protein BKA61DRAFT_572293 [Leptodontidium sp. MPI-SDFR-AT-0119]|nr:hypothetical protein BKA61DRAFT_572293 [Leptodontidium sp. MPI-SDFR-AT-0119]
MEEGNPLSPLPLLRRIDSGCDLGNLIDGLSLSSLDGDGGFEESDQGCCDLPELAVPPSTVRLSDPISNTRASVLSFKALPPTQDNSEIIDCDEPLFRPRITEAVQQFAFSLMDMHENGEMYTNISTGAIPSHGFPSDSEEYYFTLSEDSSESLCESINQSPTSLKPLKVTRYTLVNNPAGNRKYQKWIKTTALANLIESGKVKRVEGKQEVKIIENPCVQVKEAAAQEVKVDDVQEVKNNLRTKFRHGRKKKVVYRGPSCYKCSGKHHIRDCCWRFLKGKRSRKV